VAVTDGVLVKGARSTRIGKSTKKDIDSAPFWVYKMTGSDIKDLPEHYKIGDKDEEFGDDWNYASV
jgi:hypothetical protein